MKNKKMRILSKDQLTAEEIHIPIELLMDILTRLPVKTLVRFRCVCKLWCSLIDSHYFKLNPKNRKSNHLLVIKCIQGRTYDQYVVTLRSTDTFKITNHLCKIYGSYYFHGSYNGLMLMSSPNSVLRLWNPSIQKSLILPSCPLSSEGGYKLTYILGHPFSEENNYKVAVFKNAIPHVLVAIYSLQNHSWSSEIKRFNMRYIAPHVFFQGAWYWINETDLVSFRFDFEDFSVVKLPDVTLEEVTRFVFVLGESLAVLSLSSKCFCIWVLDKEGRKEPKWMPQFSRDSNQKVLHMFNSYWFQKYARIFYNQDTDKFIIKDHEKLLSYKFSTDQVRILRWTVRDEIIIDNAYSESLVLHRGTEGQTLTSFPTSHDETDF